LNKIQE